MKTNNKHVPMYYTQATHIKNSTTLAEQATKRHTTAEASRHLFKLAHQLKTRICHQGISNSFVLNKLKNKKNVLHKKRVK